MPVNNQNLYLSTTFFPDNSRVEEALELCSAHGINRIELGSNHCFEPNSLGVARRFRCDYLVHNYFPVPKEEMVLNIASLDDTIYNRSIKHVIDAIRFCGETGARLYTFHPGFLTDPMGAQRHSANYDFLFEDSHLGVTNYNKSFEQMINGVSQAVKYAQSMRVRIAIETEGSFRRNKHLLMQRPEEYEAFFRCFSPHDIGINLNIGHLNLASHAFEFKPNEFVDIVAKYVVAMELSHNRGKEDEHKPLVENEWYWEIICDNRFIDGYKILEIRNTPIENVLLNMKLIQDKFDEQLFKSNC